MVYTGAQAIQHIAKPLGKLTEIMEQAGNKSLFLHAHRLSVLAGILGDIAAMLFQRNLFAETIL